MLSFLPRRRNLIIFGPLKKQRPHEEAFGSMEALFGPSCGENLVNEAQAGRETDEFVTEGFIGLDKHVGIREVKLNSQESSG